MKITVCARCYNEQSNIERFLRCYDFADEFIISDGGSTDRSIELLESNKKVKLFHYPIVETINDETWNLDNPHINFVIKEAMNSGQDWLIMDDVDDVPNKKLQLKARSIFESVESNQINAFRLYLWGTKQYYPKMNNYFDLNYTSLWAWRPDQLSIRADENIRHGTLVGLDIEPYKINIPFCLLHYSWNPETIDAKIKRYNDLGLPMNHPIEFAGELENLPDWSVC